MNKNIKKGFLIFYGYGEYDSYQEIDIGFTMHKNIAEKILKQNQEAQKKVRYVKNRIYYEMREVDILQ